MKTNTIVQRLQKDRPMMMVSIRIPDDVIEDLRRIAPMHRRYRVQPAGTS